ncbi:helix-turn-helix domain-containing protein [Chitinophaga sancti]|uniref:winged helix-turn-helix transcriptional regulator n=1 Tax=Chitinophaga sancti TaxID=1004 RepID=UPI002A7510B0|nr:helix-turn-helix domain-containing protein [Chitinophaga sancti]WPQ66371.1 helix-turn-helix domain-containing protein [Chitinophaga sancti]
MYTRKIPRLYNCSLEVTMEVMGGKWKPFIICYLQHGPKRPSELLKMINGASKRVISQQLKELEDHEIVAKNVYAEVPLRTEYYLTDFGNELLPVVLMMEQWGRKYQPHLENKRTA